MKEANDTDSIILKGKSFLLPKNRRSVLRTWISNEAISEENRRFEEQYNNLPDSEDYIPIEIMNNSIASIVVRTKTNKVVKNAELSYENKAEITSVFSHEKHNEKLLKYDVIENSLLISDYLDGFKNMVELSDNEVSNFIEGITFSINRMIKEYDQDTIQIESKYISRLGPTGYNVHFPEFLEDAVQNNKINKMNADKLLDYHQELNRLPKQVIHGDLSRSNVMYKDNDFIIIDPKINIGRPIEDLAKFVLKSHTKEDGEDTLKLISSAIALLSEADSEEFKKWLFIYTVSIYTEYIHREKTEQSKLIVEKINRMFEYISDHVT